MAFINEYPYTDFNELNLDWLVKTVKDLSVAWAETKTEWGDMQTEWTSYKNYIDNYFANLDVSQEISDKIDQMAADGYFSSLFVTLFTDNVETQAAATTSAWIADNLLQETGYVIDSSLTVQNAAADAKAVGEKITEIREDINNMDEIIGSGLFEKMTITVTIGNIVGEVGEEIQIGTQTYWKHTEIAVSAGDLYSITFQTSNASNLRPYIVFTDNDNICTAVYAANQTELSTYKTKVVRVPSGSTKLWVRSFNVAPQVALFSGDITDFIIDCRDDLDKITKETYYIHGITGDGTYYRVYKHNENGSISGNIGEVITIGTQTYWKHIEVDCDPFELFHVYSYDSPGNTNPYVIFTDSSDVIVGTDFFITGSGTSEQHNAFVVAPSGAQKLYIRSFNASPEVYRCETLTKQLDEINVNASLNIKMAVKGKNRMLFSAHRGAEGQAPYGSYPAYEMACVQGWDMLQIAQARQSADGTWYCLHDASVDAQTNGTGNIAELTDAYIDTIYQDDGVNVDQYTHAELKLPTLESILKLAYRYGLLVSIRLGSLPTSVVGAGNLEAWQSFISLVSKYNPEKMMFSGNTIQIDILKFLTPNWHGQVYVTTNTVEDVLDDLIAKGYTNISILASEAYVDETLINKMHANDCMYVSTQFVGDPDLDDFIALSDEHCDIAQTGMSSIHSLIE